MSVNFDVKFSEQNFEFDAKCSESLVLPGGYDDGYTKGYEKGYETGNADGYTKGEAAGYTKGYTEGETSGYNKGLEEGADALDTLDSLIMRTITEYRNDRVTEVGRYAFGGCQSLKSVYLPLVTRLRSYAFYSCEGLESIDFRTALPLVTTIETYVFQYCQKLTSVKLPYVTCSIGVFRGCTRLATADFLGVNSFASQAFSECRQLKSLILRSDTMTTLGTTNAITDTPIANGTGYVYVPSALVEAYKTATNWSVYANQFRALEDYTVDGTTTGELDETKI